MSRVDHSVRVSTESVDPDAHLEVKEVLGKGAMGEVLRAADPALLRDVALKRLDSNVPDSDALRRFRTEVQVTAQLEHPSIIPVYGLVAERGRVSYTMKLVEGRTLKDWLKDMSSRVRTGQELPEEMSLEGRLEVFLSVCNAMHYAHSRGVLHRDLKPDNIMIGAFHEVLVMDWGIAKLLDGEETGPVDPESLRRAAGEGTQANTLVGTVAYMSPEQARAKPLDARSDQYALGLILFELVCLQRALRGRNALDTLFRAQNGDVSPIAMPKPGGKIRRELRAIIRKATATRREERYPDVASLADDVRRFLRDEAVHARPDGLFQRLQRQISRHRQGVLVGLLILVALGLAGLFTVTTAGMALREGERWRAEVYRAQINRLQADASRRAQDVDAALYRFEAILTGVVFAAELALARPGAERPVHLTSDWRVPGKEPPDHRPSKIYDTRISPTHADVVLAPGVSLSEVRPHVLQILETHDAMSRAQLLSAGEEALGLSQEEQSALIADRGVPAIWVYIATERGPLVGTPAADQPYPEAYDPRERPWYRLGIASDEPVWSSVDIDESGLGLLLTCSTPIRDARGAKIGVAGLDLTFGHVVGEWMTEPRPDVEVFLVDDAGLTVIRSSDAARAQDVTAYAPPPFPWPDALAQMTHPGGAVEVTVEGQPWLFVYTAMTSMPWRYVVGGPTDAMLEMAESL